MRFLVDESAGTSISLFLQSLAHDVVSVADIAPQAADRDILARAVANDRTVVTNDKDFGTLVFRGGHPHRGVVLLRLQDESAANRVRVMANVLQQCNPILPNHFIVATEAHIRVRTVS